MEKQSRCLKIQVLQQCNEINLYSQVKGQKNQEQLPFLILSFSLSPTLYAYSIAQDIFISVLNLQCYLLGIRETCILLMASAEGQKLKVFLAWPAYDSMHCVPRDRSVPKDFPSMCMITKAKFTNSQSSASCRCFNTRTGLGVAKGCN